VERAIKLKVKAADERFQVERALKPYGYNLSKRFLSFINKILHKHHTDLIQVDFYPYLSMVNYLPKDIKRIFVQHEIRYVRNQRLLAPLHLTDSEQVYFEHIKQMEIDDLNKYDHVITLTQTDKDRMQADGVKAPISVSPAAVNTPVLPFQQWNGKVTFIGGYGHIPNQEGMEWFLEEVLPHVNTSQVAALEVIGKGWPQSYHARHPKLHFLGFVEDLYQIVHNSILIVPLLSGSGMRMKILDSVFASAPIITTSKGCEGLPVENGENCMIADSAEDFAQAISRLLSDVQLQERLATNAQNARPDMLDEQHLFELRKQVYDQLQAGGSL
jgi:glycosyltransferase involved in cell wall biosynthesis